MWSEPGFSTSSQVFVDSARPVAKALGRLVFDLRIERSARLPDGPMVVASNHYSHIDPVLGFAALGRSIRYLAVDELYGQSAFFDRLTLWLGAIPMSRVRAPLGALKAALAHLDAGGVVGLFPEGRRVWTWGEAELKRGAAWLSLRARVPLVPLAIDGSQYVMGRASMRIRPAPLRIEVGDPFDPADFAAGPDPVGALTEAWASWMHERLAHDPR